MNKEHYTVDNSFQCFVCYKDYKKNLKHRPVVLRCGHPICRGCEKKQGGIVPECPSCGLENAHRGITPFIQKDSPVSSQIRLEKSDVFEWIEKLTLKEQNNNKHLVNKLEYFNHILRHIDTENAEDANPDFRLRTTNDTDNSISETPLPAKLVRTVDIYTSIYFIWAVCNAQGLRMAYTIWSNKLVVILPDKTTKVFVLPEPHTHIHEMAFIKNTPILIVTAFCNLYHYSSPESKYFIINYAKGEMKEGGFELDAYKMKIYNVVGVKHTIGLTLNDFDSQIIVYYELNETMEIVGDMLYFENDDVGFEILTERTIMLGKQNKLYFVTFEEGGNQYIEISDLVNQNVVNKVKRGDIEGLMDICFTYNFQLKRDTLELEEERYKHIENSIRYRFKIINTETSILVAIELVEEIEGKENKKMLIFYSVEVNEEEFTFKISSYSFVDAYYLQLERRNEISYKRYYYFNGLLYFLLEIRGNNFDGYILKNMGGGKDIVFYDREDGRIPFVNVNRLNIFENLIVKEEHNKLIFYELESSE